jgi:hypothetical protein
MIQITFLTSPLALLGFRSRGRLHALALQADDCDWAHGQGSLVRGPGLLLAMGMLRRELALAGLSGDGVSTLAG